jgi:hypothetical protein
MHSIRIFILSFLCLPVLGQIKPRLFEFGPKAGLLVNGIATLDTVTFKKKLSIGYQGGIFTRFNFGPLSLQPELVYQVKGGSTTAPTQAKYSYKYISTPLIVGYTPIKGIYFEAGYEPSWALNTGYKKDGLTIYGPDVATDKSLIIGTRINMLDMVSLFSLNIRFRVLSLEKEIRRKEKELIINEFYRRITMAGHASSDDAWHRRAIRQRNDLGLHRFRPNGQITPYRQLSHHYAFGTFTKGRA